MPGSHGVQALFENIRYTDNPEPRLGVDPVNDEEKRRNYALAEQLLSEQNFSRGLLAGTAAMLAAAFVYGLFGGAFGFLALGIGAAVGYAMQVFGRGIETRFTAAALILAVIGCLAGNLVIAAAYSPSYASLMTVWLSTFEVIDLVYWLLAAWAAIYWAPRPLSREERLAVGLLKLRNEKSPPGMPG